MKSRIRVIAPVAALLLGAAPRLARPDMSRHLRVDDRVGDLLNHPAFAGFSERILPGGRGSHDENLPLRDIGSLLPYHSRVDPHEVVRGLIAWWTTCAVATLCCTRLLRSGTFGLGTGTSAQGWVDDAIRFWEEARRAAGA